MHALRSVVIISKKEEIATLRMALNDHMATNYVSLQALLVKGKGRRTGADGW